MGLFSRTTKPKFKPLSDRTLIRPEDTPGEEKRGSLFIPVGAQEAPARGVIVAVGPGLTRESGDVTPMGVAVGQVVMYGKYSGAEIELEGERYIVMREPDILGVVG